MTRIAGFGLLIFALAVGVARSAPTKGDGPTTIAVGYRSVWVGMGGDGSVVRVNARSRAITARVRHDSAPPYGGYGFVHSLAVGFGSVWVAPGRYHTLWRIDPRTNRAVDVQARRAWTPTLVAAGAGAVWVGDFDRNAVFRVEPATNRVSARIRVPGGLWGLAAGRAGVWVVSVAGPRVTPSTPRQVRRLDTRTNTIGAPLITSMCDFSLAVGAQRLWVSDLCSKTVTPIGRRVGRAIPVGEASVGLAVGNGAVWVLSQSEQLVRRLDARTGRLMARVRVRGIWLATHGADRVWVLDPGDGRAGFVRTIDPRTNRVVGQPIRVAPR
jgi:DNA-binding beta-propeller fold protein YncE